MNLLPPLHQWKRDVLLGLSDIPDLRYYVVAPHFYNSSAVITCENMRTIQVPVGTVGMVSEWVKEYLRAKEFPQ